MLLSVYNLGQTRGNPPMITYYRLDLVYRHSIFPEKILH